MKIEFDKLIQNIQDGITKTFQSDVFDDVSKYNVLIGACKEFLEYKGYKIVKPLQRFNIKKLDDLIHLFYAYSDLKHPELINNYRNLLKDRALAKHFISARQKASSMSKKTAMNECAEIIATIFEHEKEFNFKQPLTFNVLGQKNCGWVTEKAIQIINRKRLKAAEEKRAEYISKLDEKYDAEPDGFGDLDEILENLNH